MVSLAGAREKARANRKLAREGGDPLAERRRARGVPSFAEATRIALKEKQPGWRSKQHGKILAVDLERYTFPRIGKIAVSEVATADVLEILTPIWHAKKSTAQSVHQRMGSVLEWAVAMEYRTDNPCDRVRSVLGPQNRVEKHMKALPYGEVGAAIRKARRTDRMPVARLAFEFLVLTAARWGEVRWAEWSEIDLGEAVWTVPATRIKGKREHRVPLCGRALEILDEARRLSGEDSRLVFTRLNGRPLFEKRLR